MGKFKFGCDPEIFLQDAAGSLVASCGLIGGTKQFPLPLPIGEGFAVQEDNVALEFCTPPAENQEQLVATINKVMSHLSDVVAQKGLEFVQSSAEYFPYEQLRHPAAQEFGCDPDYNAWRGGRRNPKPKASDDRLRSAGGHIHVGYQFKDDVEKRQLIKLMDLNAGIPSVLMDEGELRKSLYGKPGAHRLKPYGVEYRVLSNFWIFNPKLVQWAWKCTERALHHFESGYDGADVHSKEIQQAIATNDKGLAYKLVKEHDLTCEIL